eukprot:763957_1
MSSLPVSLTHMFPLVSLIVYLPVSLAHMSMQYPHPRDNNGAYAKWQANEPMITVHPQICHGLPSETTIKTGNTFTAGDTIIIDIYGSAPHAGGHCSFWYSIDDITFTKIIDIKDCTLNPTRVTLPNTMPTQCNTKCTFAFTWVPVESGACEIYMNCADIQVSGAKGGNSNGISMNFQTSFINNANDYGCIRVDDTTHWTTIFGDLQTDYDQTSNGIERKNNEILNVPCYIDQSLAINLNNEISPDGTCGNGVNDYRCDDGFCCSQSGYCGPEWDGIGYLNFETNGYFESKNDAFDAYCVNVIGDWRVNTCANNANASVQNNSMMLVLF